MKNLQFVREIDGLRALAVISVLLYHCEYKFLPGGFLGVDVFFVISGFLISRIIITQIESGAFSFSGFYVRRIARIVPAMFLMLALTCGLFSFLSPPSRSASLLEETWSAVASVSNFYFYRHVDYFSASASSPVLHTWSLSVEEQFYFVLPAFMVLVSGWSKNKIGAGLGLAMLLSFCIALTAGQFSAFYLPWCRAWELLAGVALNYFPHTRAQARGRHFLFVIGLMLIVAAFVGASKEQGFPLWLTLLPVVGSCLCIWAAVATGPSFAPLANPLTDFLGKISYSLYLLHWPLCAAALTLGVLSSYKVKAAVIFVSLALAWCSWRFVEKPCREMIVRWHARRVFVRFAAASFVMLMATLGVQSWAEQFWFARPDAVQVSSYLNNNDADFRSGSCFIYPELPKSVNFDSSCLEFQGVKNLLLVGDSHAANINGLLRKYFSDVRVIQATATGCKPVMNSEGDARCVALNTYILNEWVPKNKSAIGAVVVSARWQSEDFKNLPDTLRHLASLGLRVVVVGPHPEYRVDYPLALAYEKISGRDFVSHVFVEKQYSLDDQLRSLVTRAAMSHPGVSYYSVLDEACPQARCKKEVGGAPLMSDRDHFTQAGVEWSFMALVRALRAV